MFVFPSSLIFVETLFAFGTVPDLMLPFSFLFSLATVRVVRSWSSLRKREGDEPAGLEMSGKTLSAKSVESGILEPRKNTKGSCSMISRIPFAVNLSLSNGLSSCFGSCVSCLILDNDESTSCIGSGKTYCFDPSPFCALGGIGISVRRSERCVGFWSICPKLR